jgi:hypothetical protein
VEGSEPSADRLDRGQHAEHIEVLTHVHTTLNLDGVVGGTAQAAPEPLPPPVRPRNRPTIGLPDNATAAEAADPTRGDRHLPAEAGSAAPSLHP